MIADLHDTFQTPSRLTHLRWRLHLTRRCGARCPDPRLTDAGPCISPRHHDQYRSELWHADGTGYIWDSSQWRWMGPPASVGDYIQEPRT